MECLCNLRCFRIPFAENINRSHSVDVVERHKRSGKYIRQCLPTIPAIYELHAEISFV